eukprot:1140879-Pelagomonas_calceolata.AAC.1
MSSKEQTQEEAHTRPAFPCASNLEYWVWYDETNKHRLGRGVALDAELACGPIASNRPTCTCGRVRVAALVALRLRPLGWELLACGAPSSATSEPGLASWAFLTWLLVSRLYEGLPMQYY